MTRNDVIEEAIFSCMKELYSWVQPSTTWEDFVEENKIYKEKNLKSELAPYNFYYLPKDIMKDICDSYVYAYKIDNQQELLDTIEVLKNYCKEPIVDKWIEGELREDGTRWPGHRGYDHPDNLEKEIYKYLDSNFTGAEFENAKILQDKFFKFLDMAGKFFNWNRDLNSFNMSVYLGPSPSSNKESVIENWKKYRNQDIKIDEEQIKKEYYGEEDYC